MIPPKQTRICLLTIAILLVAVSGQVAIGQANAADPASWTKHVVMTGHHCNTAVALHANDDQFLDVIASFGGRVSLFIAPDWDREIVLHRFPKPQSGCIHSAVLDVDDDGDLDWAGSLAHGHPFWLENPGAGSVENERWKSRPIDNQITGIHCLIAADIDNDKKDDLVINNFEPEKGLGDSIVWLSVPEDVRSGHLWDRHVFADGDARGGSHYMGVGDIDGDGWKEIAVGAKGGPFEDGNWFAYWANPGQLRVSASWNKTILAENQMAATNILPADLNGDGRVDWAASRGHGVGVFWMEAPMWEIHPIDTAIKEPHSLAVGDYDQDGDIDIASCGFGSEEVGMYLNDGKGEFQHQVLDDQQQSYDLRNADMDGDGDMDLLNAGRGSRNVVWYENPLR